MEQHVPVYLISMYEMCCTCGLLTCHAIFALAQGALMPLLHSSRNCRETQKYFHAHVHLYKHKSISCDEAVE